MDNQDKKEIIRILCLMGGLVLASSLLIDAHGHEMSLGYLFEAVVSFVLGLFGIVRASRFMFSKKVVNLYSLSLFIISLFFLTVIPITTITQAISKLFYIN